MTNNTQIQRNAGEAESKDQACSRVLSSLNTDQQFTAFLSQHGLMSDGEISMHRLAVFRVPALMLQALGRSQRPPEHHACGFESSGITRELELGC